MEKEPLKRPISAGKLERDLEQVLAELGDSPTSPDPDSQTTAATGATPVVGIDLGTTYSVIAHLDETGRPVTIRSVEGDLTTPSVVLFDGDDVIVGREGLRALSGEPDRVAECAKRDLGLKRFHKAVAGQVFPPEVIQAYILKKMRDDAALQLGEFQQAVITVPAHFDEVRRKATQDAGYMAGLEVLDIINEPTAAALAAGIAGDYLAADGKSHIAQNILVYDLGGGTFDVTVMEIDGVHFRTLATDGDVQLGGRDWDQKLVDFVSEEFAGLHGFDPRRDPDFHAALWRECEDAKRTLSARQKTHVMCQFKNHRLKSEITRQKFCELTANLLERTEFTTREVLAAAGLTWDRIDRILLVGGSTRMPMVSQMIQRISGKQPDLSLSPDEAVAHGAAFLATQLQARASGRTPSFEIRNVNSHSLGLVGKHPQTGQAENVVLIRRNTSLPARVQRTFRTEQKGQRSVLMQIIEGESALPESCTQLGRIVVRDLPRDLPARSPIQVEFTYASNGRLSVHVKIGGTDRELTSEIVRENSLTQDELDHWKNKIAGKK